MERDVPMDRLLTAADVIRQNRGGPERVQVCHRREAVRHPGAYHHPCLAALPDHPPQNECFPVDVEPFSRFRTPQAAGRDPFVG